MAGLAISGARRRFGTVQAVDNVDLAVGEGEFFTLLGPSGCGKTTTLRLVAGFMAPDAGEIRVGDRVLSSPGTVIPPERRRMAMIFQSYALWPHMTVAQNVAYGLRFGGTPRAQRDGKVDEILRAVQLTGYGARYPGELSGGQQQRVAVARALAHDPLLVLADEPTGNLDLETGLQVLEILDRLTRRAGKTLVMVTHSPEVVGLADRVFRIEDCRLVERRAEG